MSYLNKNSYSKSSVYNVIYSDMRGVDFSESGNNISKNRFSYLENMYRDYEREGAGTIESIPGYRSVYDFKEKINGLFSYKDSDGYDKIVVHKKNELHEFYLSDIDAVLHTQYVSGAEDCESNAFSAKDALYVLDGKNIFKMSEFFKGPINDTNGGIYIPTTYINGVEYEQRNLLTRKFYEKFNLGFCDSQSHGTPTLKYSISDEERLECKVIGINDPEETKIHIPSRVMIGDTYYSVKRVESNAFKDNKNIEECYISNGVSTIGNMVFANASKLKKVILPQSVTEIGNGCFMSCSSLSVLHFGYALRKIGDSLISACTALNQITYSGTSSDFSKIENTAVLGNTSIVYETEINELTVKIPIFSPAISIEKISISNEEKEFECFYEDNTVSYITINFKDKTLFNGKDVFIEGMLSSDTNDYKSFQNCFLTSNLRKGGSVDAIIKECTISECFDGRVFLSGNRNYPGFCFYSSLDITGENNPLYFGEMNYFKDGVGNFNNITLLATADSLAVFKENDDGGGSIYYHSPYETDIDIIPKIYPVTYTHSGFSAKGKAISFFDDPVFVSAKGICALTKKTINLERSIATRSDNINAKLLSEDLKQIKLAVWKGYLAVLAKDKIYLADSRAIFTSSNGDLQYEWFYLKGIGSYKNDRKVFRYSSIAKDGFSVHKNTDKITEATVYSVPYSEQTIYYTIEDEIKYEVYMTDEMRGGDFYAASHLLSVNDLLLFATEAGMVCVFNTDKYGAAPPYLTQNPNFDKEDYQKSYSSRLHSYYYSFLGHAPRYAIQTKNDDCSIPHLTKSTVKDSLALKCKVLSSGTLTCEIGTDNNGYREICNFPNQDIFFSDLNFAHLTLSTDTSYTIPIHEKTKGWIEKQITVYTDEYASAFGIYMLAYQFKVKGKIKKRR